MTDRVDVTVYESIGFKYLCIGIQVSVPLGAGSVGCASDFTTAAQVTANPESCSIAGMSPSSDFTSNTGKPTCFLKLSNTGTAGTNAAACFVGGQSGSLLSASAGVPPMQIQIMPSGVAYVECQAPSGIPMSPGDAVSGQIALTNGASVLFASTWSA